MKWADIANVTLIAHNGNKFDLPVLINGLKRNNLHSIFMSNNVFLVDSLRLISMEMKQKASPLHSYKGKSLSDLYEFLLKEKFDVHDAQEEAVALSQILFQTPLKISVYHIFLLTIEYLWTKYQESHFSIVPPLTRSRKKALLICCGHLYKLFLSLFVYCECNPISVCRK